METVKSDYAKNEYIAFLSVRHEAELMAASIKLIGADFFCNNYADILRVHYGHLTEGEIDVFARGMRLRAKLNLACALIEKFDKRLEMETFHILACDASLDDCVRCTALQCSKGIRYE
jgi:hypothetical protein